MIFKSQEAIKRYGPKRLAILILQFSILFLFWLILSGHYQAKYILMGVMAAGLVTLFTHDLFYSLFHRSGEKKTNVRLSLLQMWRFMAYLPWLFSKIIIANLQVAYLVLHPRMPIDPVLLQFKTRLKLNLAQVILANSITLTPGTVTVNLEEGKYIVHALIPSAAQEILTARMQNKIGAIFLEEKESPPDPQWRHSLEEMEQ